MSPKERIRVILVAVAHTLKLSFHYGIDNDQLVQNVASMLRSEKQENFPGPRSLSRRKMLPLF